MFQYTADLSVCECANCHMDFAITKKFMEDRRNDHKTFYCPSGHPNVFREESELERTRRERDQAIQRAAYKDDEIRRERERKEHAQNTSRTYKGHLTRTRRRISAGVCPCCNRTFQNLARHMESKHQAFAKKEAV